MLYDNFNSFYTLRDSSEFGTSVAALGDLDGNGVEDIAVGASTADDGGSDAGEVIILFLETDGNVKDAQKVSALYGGLSTYFTLPSGGRFGSAVVSMGDTDGDGTTDLAVGAYDISDGGSWTGAVFLINLAQTYCETPSPTAVPASAGTCYHHTSTATRLANNGIDTAHVPLTELAVGHRILALDHHARPTFAQIQALPFGPDEGPYDRIVMADKAKHELTVTLHHMFDACASKHNQGAIQAMDLRAGDCLHTTDGKATVYSTKHVAPMAGDETYSIKLAGVIGTVAIGGVFTHAMGHVQQPGKNKHARNKYKRMIPVYKISRREMKVEIDFAYSLLLARTRPIYVTGFGIYIILGKTAISVCPLPS